MLSCVQRNKGWVLDQLRSVIKLQDWDLGPWTENTYTLSPTGLCLSRCKRSTVPALLLQRRQKTEVQRGEIQHTQRRAGFGWFLWNTSN